MEQVHNKRAGRAAPMLKTIAALLQKKNTLFFLGIAGIVLIFLSDALLPAKEKPAQPAAGAQSAVQADTEAYRAEMERQLVTLLSGVQGAGECHVMITLESAGETVYAQDEKNTAQTQTGETGVQAHQSAYENQHVLLDTDSGRAALVQTQLLPPVQGVAVVCEGGEDITVVSRITELVSVVFGLPTNRICVTK